MKLSRFFKLPENPAGTETPLFLFATCVLTGIGIWSAVASPALRDPVRLVPFIILMVVHIGLYWAIGFVVHSHRQTMVYLVAQGLLAFTLNLLGQEHILVLVLYMAMLGIAIGALRLTRVGILFVFYYLGLSLINYTILEGWQDAGVWAITVIPTSLFVGLYVILYTRQIDARDHARDLLVELEKANRQLAEYAERVESLTLAAERQRMARELHDTLSQGLAGLILALEAAEAHLASQRVERTAKILHDSIAQARSTLAESRRAIDDLRQAQPEAASLPDVLRGETQRFSQATGIQVDLAIDWANSDGMELAETVQRTLSEGLTNLARHAHATRCQVGLAEHDGWLELTLVDNGVGFDPQSASGQPGHYGLLGMEERARLHGGTLTITSQPGAGATLRLRLPVGQSQAIQAKVES